MPSISFIMPHWIYWGTLILFPLVAMVMARRPQTSGYSLAIAYMILVTGGLLGLHRLYLRNLWGLVYLPVFFVILFANAQGRDAREAQSEASNIVNNAQRVISRLEPKVEGAEARLAQLRAELAEADEGSFARKSAERKLEKAEQEKLANAERLEQARAERLAAEPALAAATAARAKWSNVAFGALMVLCAMMLVDALLLPGLVRRAQASLPPEPERPPGTLEAIEREAEARPEQLEHQEPEGDWSHVGTGWTGWIDRLSFYSGEFVSYWMVIAVIAYYFEVLARYVFNSPTVWVHEGMYLMFGMQYLIAGAYAALTDAHVKVDVFYARWSPLRRAVVDLLTSVFFFLFAGTLLVTGWIFAMDATVVNEMSFSEWQIAYWPFKWAIVVGAALLILQGISKLARDVDTVRSSLRGA